MTKVLLSIPEDFLSTVDRVAVSQQRSRSELIREALRSYINRKNMPSPEKANLNAEILEDLIG